MKTCIRVAMAVAFFTLFFNVNESFALDNINFNGKQMVAKKIVSCFSTTFSGAKRARTNNVILASKLCHGLVIKPGDIVSFNKIVGPRTEERGFKKAGSFFQGKVVPSVGGGICQVASTIFAAVIDYGLKILERHHHSMPVSYISPEKEATVAYGQKDLRFKNTTKEVLYMKCFVRQNILHVELWRCS